MHYSGHDVIDILNSIQILKTYTSSILMSHIFVHVDAVALAELLNSCALQFLSLLNTHRICKRGSFVDFLLAFFFCSIGCFSGAASSNFKNKII